MKKTKKHFDCLKEKERIQSEIRKEIAGKTLEEERAVYNSEIKDKKFAAWVEKVKRNPSARGRLKKSG